MKTNLIFKRNVIDGNITKVELKIVPVEIPGIESNSGWILSGHADIISQELDTDTDTVSKPSVEKHVQLPIGSKFQSDVVGTAKLVRSNNTIKIVARKGKKTLNETTPNSVCISDATKISFFNDCRISNCTNDYSFNSSSKYFNVWNDYMDREYKRQLDQYNRR